MCVCVLLRAKCNSLSHCVAGKQIDMANCWMQTDCIPRGRRRSLVTIKSHFPSSALHSSFARQSVQCALLHYLKLQSLSLDLLIIIYLNTARQNEPATVTEEASSLDLSSSSSARPPDRQLQFALARVPHPYLLRWDSEEGKKGGR